VDETRSEAVLIRPRGRIRTGGERPRPTGAAPTAPVNKEIRRMRVLPVLLAAAACLVMAVPAAAIQPGGCCGPQCCDAACAQGCCGQACCAQGCCGQACCGSSCGQCCVVECDTMTVKKVIWKCECKPFCLPLPTCCKGCTKCVVCSCGGCDAGCCDAACGCDAGCCDGACGSCGSGCGRTLCVPVQAPPKCGKVCKKKILFRGFCEIEVPVYKCVVKCGGAGCCAPGCCGEGAPAEPAAPEAPAAPAPAPEARITGLAPLPPM
jgi:hypothetical protein